MMPIKIKIAWVIRCKEYRQAMERHNRDLLKKVADLSAFYDVKVPVIVHRQGHTSQRSAHRVYKDFTAIPGLEKEGNNSLYYSFMKQRLDIITSICCVEDKILALFYNCLANANNWEGRLSQYVSKLSPCSAITMLKVLNAIRKRS
jgi:hypothetical protein